MTIVRRYYVPRHEIAPLRDDSERSARVLREYTDRKGQPRAESQRRLLVKYPDPRGTYKSFAETMLGIGIDALLREYRRSKS